MMTIMSLYGESFFKNDLDTLHPLFFRCGGQHKQNFSLTKWVAEWLFIDRNGGVRRILVGTFRRRSVFHPMASDPSRRFD